MQDRQNTSMLGKVDWGAIMIYLALALMGWINIYAAVFDEAHSNILDMGQRYGMQIIWIGISLFLGVTILLIDDKYYHILSYPLYWIMIVVLLGVMLVGKEVNGAQSWIVIGPVALQPAEFAKFTSALALARYMSTYNFSIHEFKSLMIVGAIIALPALIIIFQNDTGSAVVYGAFLFVLYREGFNNWAYVATLMVIMLFVFSFIFTPITLLVVLILFCVISEGLVNGNWRSKIIYLAAIALGAIIIYFGLNVLLETHITVYYSVMITCVLSLIMIAIYAYRYRLQNAYMYVALFFGSLAFTFTIDYVFDNVLQMHQQKRILDLLGLESDLKGWGYNVNQSKIAIGSGGFWGKGFLNGTQTKYNFVPEQSTDFIFCTVGEEWGFFGSFVVISLFFMLITKLMSMGERQQEPFGRIYCYSVAAIFLFHILINIGMTIGIMPVIGIPLPFFSYGGSSFLAFTVLFFVAVKLDAAKREMIIHR